MSLIERFLVFEGLPGSGKTSLTRRLSRKPGRFRVGEHLLPNFREVLFHNLKSPSASFFLESDKRKYLLAQNAVRRRLFPLLDRSFVSTLAYSYSFWKQTGNKELYDLETDWFNKHKTLFVSPLAYIYLSLDPCASSLRTSIRRGSQFSYDRIEERIDNLRYTIEFYNLFFFSKGNPSSVHVLDASLPFETVLHQAEQIIANYTFCKLGDI